MKVSVVVPTSNRQHYFRPLYRCFREQTHAETELLVLDDSMYGSTYFRSLGDPRVRYFHIAPGTSLGHKRNELVGMATGDVIAQFDDDDYYAPDYLEFMVDALGNADLVKLAGFYVYMAGADPSRADFFGYWDTAAAEPHCYALTPGGGAEVREGLAVEDRNLFGYGFSYVFRKDVFERVRFPDVNFGEDYELVVRMRDAGLRPVHRHDDRGLALHMLHARNCSAVFPQYRMPARWVRNVFGPAIDRYLPGGRRGGRVRSRGQPRLETAPWRP